MEKLYWIVEYGKVLCGYMFFMFLWPSVVFGRHLKGKGKRYRFAFCTLSQALIANFVVLGLGLAHLLNRWVVFAFYYGIFFVSVGKRLNFQNQQGVLGETIFAVYRLIMGTSGRKQFLRRMCITLGGGLKRGCRRFLDSIQGHRMECALLFIVVVYGMIYFSYGVFQDYNYGFGDMYVHHEWIDGLLKGKVFCKGVYPQAMHCFIYCLHVLFGVKVHSCMLFAAGIHVAVTLISIYCFLKESFEWKYTPIFVLILFLTIDLMCIDEIYGMARLQWTIPQEFGLYTLFLCALYLLRYLKSPRKNTAEGRSEKYVLNENLFLFMLSLAASIAIHFYTTIMAFLLCVSFAVCFFRTVLKKERFLPLAAAVLCGVLISVTPMIAARALGIPFEGSIGWALGVMNGEEQQKEETEDIQETEEAEEIQETDNRTILEKAKSALFALRWYGYGTLYKERERWIIGFTGLAVILWISYQMIRCGCRLFLKRQFRKKYFTGCMPIILASVLFMIVYASPFLGLPQIIAGQRLLTTEQLLLLAIIVMPLDVIFTVLSLFLMDGIVQALSVFAAAGICSFVILSGSYHGYLYCELSRYNAAIEITNSIISRFPEFGYTIVSTTDEIFQVINDGRHEELLAFMQEVDKENYTLPTEYVFLYVEKRPLEYGQSHFFQGPKWLAEDKYADIFGDLYASRCPEIKASEISAQKAQRRILTYARPSESYTKPESRLILESKEYLWCQNFLKTHPFEMNVYYEDDDFVCYYFKQNPYALYNLAIEDWDSLEGIEWPD